jgi:hypothetical protein
MQNENSTGIILAIITGVCMVLGAIVFGNFSSYTDSDSKTIAIKETNAPPREEITITTQTTNGLPAWQAELLDTPTPTSQQEGKNDTGVDLVAIANGTYVKPDTLTADYGNAIAQEVMRAEFEGASEAEVAAVRKAVNKRIANEMRDDLYTVKDLKIIRNSDAAIRTYGNTAITIVRDNPVTNANSELDLLRRGLRLDDTGAFQELQEIAQIYASLRDGYLATPVPATLADAHLKLINSYNILHHSVMDMADAEADPLRAYLRSEQFANDTRTMLQAYQNMGIEVIRHQDKFTAEDPALLFAMYLPGTN